MKIGILSLFFIISAFLGYTQNHVSWDVSYNANESKVLVHATIGEGWHLYSTEEATELGPIPTEIKIKEQEGVEVIGRLHEPEPIVSYDPNFEETLFYFEKSVTFSQEVKVADANELNGTITYMVCNDEMCMPPVDYEFTIELTDEN